MTLPRRPVPAVLAGAAAVGALVASAAPAAADPVDPFVVPAPPPPIVTYPVAPVANGAAMTPRQQALPPGAAPVQTTLSESGIPEIANPQYGSGNNGGGILGTLKDLWDQVKNPAFVPGEIMGGPAPLPPGAPAAPAPAGSAGPNLPPGYYPLDGPPPPGYEYLTPGPAVPTAQ